MPKPTAICVFEDDDVADLFPLTHLRPLYDLRCGALSLVDRIRRRFPEAAFYRRCREYVAPLNNNPDGLINQNPPDGCLYINGRVVIDDQMADLFEHDNQTTFTAEGQAVAFWNNTLSTRRTEITGRVIRYPWDLVRFNGDLLLDDFKFFGSVIRGAVHPGAHVLGPERVFVGDGANVQPGVVLDAQNGPVIIDQDAVIMPNAVLEGPVYVGRQSRIRIGAKIYGNTSIGAVCKIGGEVEGSVIHGYSNKQHDGFLGHSYIAEWCNLGADTNTSDLKNSYGPVKVTLNGREIDTGMLFVGLTMGDHSKCGINTMFNTGTVVGVSCNIFGGGFPPKVIPGFSWMDVPSLEDYQIDKAIEVARQVMARRHIILSDEYANALKHVFHLTAAERERARSV